MTSDIPPPDEWETLFQTAFRLLTQGLPDEAQATLETLLSARPNYPNGLWLRAGILRRKHSESSPEVLTAYNLALQFDPDNPYLQLERADILRAQNQPESARLIYSRLASADVSSNETLQVEAAFQLGCVCLVLNDRPAARAALQQVLTLAPDYPDAALMLQLCELPAS